MVPEICSGQKITDGGRRTDIWITKSLPDLSSGETINNWISDQLTKTWIGSALIDIKNNPSHKALIGISKSWTSLISKIILINWFYNIPSHTIWHEMLIFHPTHINMNLLKSSIAILITFYNCLGATSTISYNSNLIENCLTCIKYSTIHWNSWDDQIIYLSVWHSMYNSKLQFCDKKQDYKNFFSSKTAFQISCYKSRSAINRASKSSNLKFWSNFGSNTTNDYL